MFQQSGEEGPNSGMTYAPENTPVSLHLVYSKYQKISHQKVHCLSYHHDKIWWYWGGSVGSLFSGGSRKAQVFTRSKLRSINECTVAVSVPDSFLVIFWWRMSCRLLIVLYGNHTVTLDNLSLQAPGYAPGKLDQGVFHRFWGVRYLNSCCNHSCPTPFCLG